MLKKFGPKITRNLRDGISCRQHEDNIYNEAFNNGVKPIFGNWTSFCQAKKGQWKWKQKSECK